jgi:hypothetical protein
VATFRPIYHGIRKGEPKRTELIMRKIALVIAFLTQKYSTPVFALADAQIEQVGVILETMKTSRDNFRKSFDALANSIENITGMTPKPRIKKNQLI